MGLTVKERESRIDKAEQKVLADKQGVHDRAYYEERGSASPGGRVFLFPSSCPGSKLRMYVQWRRTHRSL